MQYFKFLKIVILTFTINIIGCSSPSSKTENNFLLLPSVSEINLTNQNSMIDIDFLNFAYSPTGDSLPIRYGSTKKLKIADLAENSQIEFSILYHENQVSESYSLEIESNKIKIQAQDKAGLFYAFVTLNQLLEDARNQQLTLPLVKIKDSPKIAFRPIHIDVKHH